MLELEDCCDKLDGWSVKHALKNSVGSDPQGASAGSESKKRALHSNKLPKAIMPFLETTDKE